MTLRTVKTLACCVVLALSACNLTTCEVYESSFSIADVKRAKRDDRIAGFWRVQSSESNHLDTEVLYKIVPFDSRSYVLTAYNIDDAIQDVAIGRLFFSKLGRAQFLNIQSIEGSDASAYSYGLLDWQAPHSVDLYVVKDHESYDKIKSSRSLRRNLSKRRDAEDFFIHAGRFSRVAEADEDLASVLNKNLSKEPLHWDGAAERVNEQ